jgi:hypothetical protein
MLLGMITRPSYTQIKKEFGDIGTKSGYNDTLSKNLYHDDEIEDMKKLLAAQ